MAQGMGHGAWGMEQGAWEDRALRNDPVGHFSEGACLQGRHGACQEQCDWSREAGGYGEGMRDNE